MSQRLSRVVFVTPVQDPGAPGQFERRDFNKTSAPKLAIERADDGTITLTSPDGTQVIATGVAYWCNPLREQPVTLAPTTPPVPPAPPKPTLPPVTQSQAHPRDRLYRGGKKP